MKILKFNLSGKTAFFKKPDVNSIYYFTYGHIHKVALLGIFGAIMGYGGYNQQVRSINIPYPEFYEKLKNIKISIVPEQNNNYKKFVPNKITFQKGYFAKKVQTFNNTVGYANADGNLIVKEQWLENPCWDIYLMLQGELEEMIAERILSSKTRFIPYLGKNDHMAVLSNAEIIEMENISCVKEFRIDSLFQKEYFKISCSDKFDGLFDYDEDIEVSFKYEERLPIALEQSTNQYITSPFIFTNSKVVLSDKDSKNTNLIGCCNEKIIQFY